MSDVPNDQTILVATILKVKSIWVRFSVLFYNKGNFYFNLKKLETNLGQFVTYPTRPRLKKLSIDR